MIQARKKEKELISNSNNFGDKLHKPKKIESIIDVPSKETDDNQQVSSTQNVERELSFLDGLDEDRRKIALAAYEYIYDDD